MAPDFLKKSPRMGGKSPGRVGPNLLSIFNILICKVPGPTYFKYYKGINNNNKIYAYIKKLQGWDLRLLPLFSANPLFPQVKIRSHLILGRLCSAHNSLISFTQKSPAP